MTGGMITPFRMEQLLNNQYKKTIDSYETFVDESEQDLRQTQEELNSLQKILEEEQKQTRALEHDKKLNDEEMARLGADY